MAKLWKRAERIDGWTEQPRDKRKYREYNVCIIISRSQKRQHKRENTRLHRMIAKHVERTGDDSICHGRRDTKSQGWAT
jgi:hypothetical protein